MEGGLTWRVAAFLSDVCVYGVTKELFSVYCLWKKEIISIMMLIGKSSRLSPSIEQQDSRSER